MAVLFHAVPSRQSAVLGVTMDARKKMYGVQCSSVIREKSVSQISTELECGCALCKANKNVACW